MSLIDRKEINQSTLEELPKHLSEATEIASLAGQEGRGNGDSLHQILKLPADMADSSLPYLSALERIAMCE